MIDKANRRAAHSIKPAACYSVVTYRAVQVRAATDRNPAGAYWPAPAPSGANSESK